MQPRRDCPHQARLAVWRPRELPGPNLFVGQRARELQIGYGDGAGTIAGTGRQRALQGDREGTSSDESRRQRSKPHSTYPKLAGVAGADSYRVSYGNELPKPCGPSADRISKGPEVGKAV